MNPPSATNLERPLLVGKRQEGMQMTFHVYHPIFLKCLTVVLKVPVDELRWLEKVLRMFGVENLQQSTVDHVQLRRRMRL